MADYSTEPCPASSRMEQSDSPHPLARFSSPIWLEDTISLHVADKEASVDTPCQKPAPVYANEKSTRDSGTATTSFSASITQEGQLTFHGGQPHAPIEMGTYATETALFFRGAERCRTPVNMTSVSRITLGTDQHLFLLPSDITTIVAHTDLIDGHGSVTITARHDAPSREDMAKFHSELKAVTLRVTETVDLTERLDLHGLVTSFEIDEDATLILPALLADGASVTSPGSEQSQVVINGLTGSHSLSGIYIRGPVTASLAGDLTYSIEHHAAITDFIVRDDDVLTLPASMAATARVSGTGTVVLSGFTEDTVVGPGLQVDDIIAQFMTSHNISGWVNWDNLNDVTGFEIVNDVLTVGASLADERPIMGTGNAEILADDNHKTEGGNFSVLASGEIGNEVTAGKGADTINLGKEEDGIQQTNGTADRLHYRYGDSGVTIEPDSMSMEIDTITFFETGKDTLDLAGARPSDVGTNLALDQETVTTNEKGIVITVQGATTEEKICNIISALDTAEYDATKVVALVENNGSLDEPLYNTYVIRADGDDIIQSDLVVKLCGMEATDVGELLFPGA